MEWLKKAALKDRRLTPSKLINAAIDQLIKKEEAERDPTPEQIAKWLEEDRKARAELRGIAESKP
jgi:post-segregation antitoxin (ccd killing protein)